MQAWAASIVVSLLTKLTSWLLARGLEAIHGRQEKAATDADVDQKLSAFKAAYKEAFNGKPVTPDERAKLNQAVANFIRNTGTGGL